MNTALVLVLIAASLQTDLSLVSFAAEMWELGETLAGIGPNTGPTLLSHIHASRGHRVDPTWLLGLSFRAAVVRLLPAAGVITNPKFFASAFFTFFCDLTVAFKTMKFTSSGPLKKVERIELVMPPAPGPPFPSSG